MLTPVLSPVWSSNSGRGKHKHSPRRPPKRTLRRTVACGATAALVWMAFVLPQTFLPRGLRHLLLLRRDADDNVVLVHQSTTGRVGRDTRRTGCGATTSAAEANATNNNTTTTTATTPFTLALPPTANLPPGCPPHRRPGRLRTHWPTTDDNMAFQTLNQSSSTLEHQDRLSPLAQELRNHQSNCTKPIARHIMDNTYGLGSHLHVWSQALCNAMEQGRRVQSHVNVNLLVPAGINSSLDHNHAWLWNDEMACPREATAIRRASPLHCYFPRAEQRCGELLQSLDQDTPSSSLSHSLSKDYVNVTDPRDLQKRCHRLRGNNDKQKSHALLRDFRTASIEYLFSSLRPLVVAEAERQIGLLFGNDDLDEKLPVYAPRNMVVVHMRWGDKFWEMDLPSEFEYVSSVCQLLKDDAAATASHTSVAAPPFDCNSTIAAVYLSTEDPRAARAFQSAAPKTWTVYLDRTLSELGVHRPNRGNRASHTARNTQGRAGLVALGSLLVSLEGTRFVLTTQSNWSRLIDALRRSVIDRQCGNCTRSIDLRPGEW